MATTTEPTYGDYFAAVLTQLGAPVTTQNLDALGSVAALEGIFGTAGYHNGVNGDRFNPLNSTVAAGTSRPINSAGVQDYENYNQGVQGTVSLLQGSRWASVREALQAGDSTGNVLSAFESTYATWGSHVTFNPSSGAAVVSKTFESTGAPGTAPTLPYAIGSLKGPLTDTQRATIYKYLAANWGVSITQVMTEINSLIKNAGSQQNADALIISTYNTAAANPGKLGGVSGGSGQTSTVPNISLPGWTGELGTVLGDVLDGGLWKRAGIILIGVVVIGVAAVILLRKPIESGVTSAAKIGAVVE